MNCKKRKDLNGILIPIGNKYMELEEPVPFQWMNNNFYVKINNRWILAESTDFEFN